VIRRFLGRLRRAARASIVPRFPRLSRLRQPVADLLTILREVARAIRRRPARHRPGTLVRLRIGIDIRPFYEPLTGVGWYLQHLLHALSRRSDVDLILFGDPFVTDEGPHLHASLPANASVTGFDFRGRNHSRFARRLARLAYPALALIERCDLFFGANFFLPRSLSSIARRRVVTVHDLTFKVFPEMLQTETLSNLSREMERELFRCDAVICVSEATRSDLLRFFDLAPGKAVAVLSGLEPLPTTLVDLDLPDDYLLFVSTIEPRKNLGVLLEAYETLRRHQAYQGDLVVVGKVGWKSAEVMERLARSPWSRSIHRLDYLNREQLAAVYRKCRIFVLPSHYEGFGFPILEAMSAGAPVIAARRSSLPEIGGDAALYFDPDDAAQLAEAIRTLINDETLRQRLTQAGKIRAASFSWDVTAEQTMVVFRRAAQ